MTGNIPLDKAISMAEPKDKEQGNIFLHESEEDDGTE